MMKDIEGGYKFFLDIFASLKYYYKLSLFWYPSIGILPFLKSFYRWGRKLKTSTYKKIIPTYNNKSLHHQLENYDVLSYKPIYKTSKSNTMRRTIFRVHPHPPCYTTISPHSLQQRVIENQNSIPFIPPIDNGSRQHIFMKQLEVSL